MRNLLFLMLVGLFCTDSQAQFKSEADRNIDVLTARLVQIKNSEQPVNMKEDHIIKELNSYLADYQMGKTDITIQKDHAPDCGPQEVSLYLEDFISHRLDVVSPAYYERSPVKGSRCAFDKAEEIYSTVGTKYLSRGDICKIMDCQKSNQEYLPKSRGVQEVWRFVGIKRYFTDEDNQGWRYLCLPEKQEDIFTDEKTERIENLLKNMERGSTLVSSTDQVVGIKPGLKEAAPNTIQGSANTAQKRNIPIDDEVIAATLKADGKWLKRAEVDIW